jgi:hypothetical protein
VDIDSSVSELCFNGKGATSADEVETCVEWPNP